MARSSTRNLNLRSFMLWGALVGCLAGFVAALIAAVGAPQFWGAARIHWAQFGCVGWAFGAAGGCLLAHLIERRRARRTARGLCSICGYNLTGNVSGRCPECGTPVPGRRRRSAARRASGDAGGAE